MNTLRQYCTDTYSKNQKKFEIRKIEHSCGIITKLKCTTLFLSIELVMLVILLFYKLTTLSTPSLMSGDILKNS